MGFRFGHPVSMRNRFRKQLADYLRKQRGDKSLLAFARKLGISDSTLQRLEIAEQNITIDTLEQIVDRLKCDLSDVFGVTK